MTPRRHIPLTLLGRAARKLSLPADRNHRLVGSLAVEVPEFLEIRPVEVSRLLTGIDESGFELLGLHRLADGRPQRRHDLRRRASWREYPDPKIVFHVEPELLEHRHIGHHLRTRRAEDGERAQLPRFDVWQRSAYRQCSDLRIIAEHCDDRRAAATGRQMAQLQRAGRFFQIGQRQMACAIEPARSEYERLWLRFGAGDELL